MSLGGLGQRKRPGDVQLEASVAQQGEAPIGALARLVGEASRQGRQREGADLLRLRREHGEVDWIRWVAGATVQDEVPERGETAEPFLDGGLADRVENEIDASIAGEPQHFVRELVLDVVDDRVRAGLLRQTELGVARDGSEDTGAGGPGELDGGKAYAACCRVDENALARARGVDRVQEMVCGEDLDQE